MLLLFINVYVYIRIYCKFLLKTEGQVEQLAYSISHCTLYIYCVHFSFLKVGRMTNKCTICADCVLKILL